MTIEVSNALSVPDKSPAGKRLRLITATSHLKTAVERVKVERHKSQESRRIIEEGLKYHPQILEEVARLLTETQTILTSRSPQRNEGGQDEFNREVDNQTKALLPRAAIELDTESRNRTARTVSRELHDDAIGENAGNVDSVFGGTSERRAVYQLANEATSTIDVLDATILASQLHLQTATDVLSSGAIDEGLTNNPNLLGSLELACYRAAIRFPHNENNEDRKDPIEQAKFKAREIKVERDTNALNHSFNYVFATLAEVHNTLARQSNGGYNRDLLVFGLRKTFERMEALQVLLELKDKSLSQRKYGIFNGLLDICEDDLRKKIKDLAKSANTLGENVLGENPNYSLSGTQLVLVNSALDELTQSLRAYTRVVSTLEESGRQDMILKNKPDTLNLISSLDKKGGKENFIFNKFDWK